jgi:predicted DNA-binding transcriptional regulator YafY
MHLPVARRHQLARLFLIANRLETGERLTRADLAALCDCSLRTITRDLAFLRAAGVELEYDPRQQTYALQAPLPFQSVQFSLTEIMALAAAREALTSHSSLPWAPSLRAAFQRLTTRLPDNLRALLSSTQSVFDSAPSLRRDYAQAPWEQLATAARRRQTVEICYHSLHSDTWSVRRVDPYRLAERSGYLVLVGYCHRRREVREFALDRIRTLTLTDDSFKVPPSFDADEYLRGSLHALRGEPTAIAVRFDAALAPYARRRQWQFPHTIEECDDGAVLLRGTVSGLEGIKTELLSWGSGFQVLEPPALRETMRRIGEAIAATHSEE